MSKRQISVGEFIIKYGIEALQGKSITLGDYSGNMKLSNDELEFHNKENFDREHAKRFKYSYYSRFHRHGNYRLRMCYVDQSDGMERCLWVYKSDLIDDIE